MSISEDSVRDGYSKGKTFIKGARQLLGLDIPDESVTKGTGQTTTFRQLGFSCTNNNHKPDGWYLPKETYKVALVLETKNSDENLYKKDWEKELFVNIKVISSKYKRIIGILYNGNDIRVFKYNGTIEEVTSGLSDSLQEASYYCKLFDISKLPKELIYNVTTRINNNLHFRFGIQDLQARMVFTACALVAQRYNPVNGLQRLKGMGYSAFHNWIYSALSKAIEQDKNQNIKLEILLEEYAYIKMAITEDQIAIDSFIDDVCKIANLVNSDNWNGEDVMAIFFNEFNRYRKKSEAGQVLTPDHITSFMYRLLDVNKDDRILDATCGSGAFLVKSMCNMIKDAGGVSTNKAALIKSEQLYGIEMYRKMFALACANMMIHKDGKTNLAQMDARTEEASEWIKSKNITKVMMNPPYERKYGCLKIVENVLNSVPKDTLCAFIMPDKKLEKNYKDSKYHNKLLKQHSLMKIIKLPENLFFGVGVTTSIFIFKAGVPQDNKNIIGYYIEDDGLETVKNKGRQDINNKWDDIEDYWIESIRDGEDIKFNTKQIIKPSEHLSYQMPQKKFAIYEEDFLKTSMDYYMFKDGIDVNEFTKNMLFQTMYSSKLGYTDNTINISLIRNNGGEDD